MSSTRWEWAENSSSSSHVQRVANGIGSRSAEAYRKYVTHGAGCEGCAAARSDGGTRCAEGGELWQAYDEARGETDQW